MTTPQTAAGRAHVHYYSTWGGTCRCGASDPDEEYTLTGRELDEIRAEARAAALDEARAAVNDCASFANYPETGDLIMRRHALAAIDALRERSE